MIPKFRVWHKTWKEMGKVTCIHFDDKQSVISMFCEEEQASSALLDDEVILMQSTGLHDKNGKEIFEGDIIRTSAYGCIVGFGEYTYFEDDDTQITEIGFYLSFLNVTPATYAPFDNYYWENCEVIGNIHENKLDLIMYELHKYNKTTSEEVE